MTVEQSTEIGELAKALAAAQGEIETASKDKVNPAFRSKYADLASVWDACRAPLSKNGLSVVQQPVNDGTAIGVVTTLLHSSGQFMRSTLWMQPKDTGPHASGSCITYCRRFSLASFVSVAPDDDDGNGASGRAGPMQSAADFATRDPQQRAANGSGAKTAPRANTVKHDGVMASPEAVKLLHTLKGKVGGMTDDAYRKQLAAFKDADGKPVTTSKDLSEAQIDNLIGRYKAQIDRQGARASQGFGPPEDPGDMLSADGVTTIRSTLREQEMAEGELCAIFGVDHVTELQATQAGDALALVLSFGTDRYEKVLADVRGGS